MSYRAKTICVAVGLIALLSTVYAHYFDLWNDPKAARMKPGVQEEAPTPAEQFALQEFDPTSVCACYWNQEQSEHPVPIATEDGSEKSAKHASAMQFSRVRRIFVEHCFQCHGPDQQEGDLRLDQRQSAFSVAASGEHPIVPGHPEKSTLLQRVLSDDQDLRMPADGDPLSQEEVETLREWIAAGAEWPVDSGHWAFQKPRRPALPEIVEADWPRNPVDHFVLSRLEAEGLPPSPEADRRTLMRRLSLDLIGLPPRPEELDAFVADESPDAYEQVVDRLLASPHFGERWAVQWFDLARYADTEGYEHDAPRKSWLYRDWVIHALNTDMPFDRFTVEQLAGDLLPDATETQQIATGFMRNAMVSRDLKQYRFETLIDRTNTLGTIWLGLSMSCAQCHDHKFDPITQKEYYQLYTIFDMARDDIEGGSKTRLAAQSPLKVSRGKIRTSVMSDDGIQRPAHVKIRGAYHADGEEVHPGVPAAFHTPKCDVKDRLGLACWLVDEENPLTARVMVNRYWEWIFGTGIVRTSEDLGMRSEPPSHVELLDWLATEFVEQGWSMKHLLRLIVTSSTYRQSSRFTPESFSHDPRNRLLSRGARYRLNAETIRDIAMAASGLLAKRVGGPSVFPIQPPGVNQGHFMFGDFSWEVNSGRDRYRRGVYTFWKRTSLYPSLELFNAPRREKTCPRRSRSNTPLQALTTLNDPAFFEAAVHLAGRMLTEVEGGFPSRLRRGFRLTLSRAPADEEVEQLKRFYDTELSRFRKETAAARTLLGDAPNIQSFSRLDIGEWAAWTMVANVLLNLDETITKE